VALFSSGYPIEITAKGVIVSGRLKIFFNPLTLPSSG